MTFIIQEEVIRLGSGVSRNIGSVECRRKIKTCKGPSHRVEVLLQHWSRCIWNIPIFCSIFFCFLAGHVVHRNGILLQTGDFATFSMLIVETYERRTTVLPYSVT